MTIICGSAGKLKCAGRIWVPCKSGKISKSKFREVKFEPSIDYDHNDYMLLSISKDGQLTSACSNVNTPDELGYVPAICDPTCPIKVKCCSTMKSVRVGLNFIIMLGTDGQLYQVGSSDGAIGTEVEAFAQYRKLPGMYSFIYTSKSEDMYAAVNQYGAMWFWGDNYERLMPLGAEQMNVDMVSEPALVSLPPKVYVSSCSFGMSHCLILSKAGNCYYTGYMHDCDSFMPRTSGFERIILTGDSCESENDNILSISSGTDNALAMDDRGRVFSWGRNHMGQTGMGTASKFQKPQILKLPPAYSIRCYADTSIVVTTNGVVYGFGDNGDAKRLGVSRDIIVPTPTIIGKVRMIDNH